MAYTQTGNPYQDFIQQMQSGVMNNMNFDPGPINNPGVYGAISTQNQLAGQMKQYLPQLFMANQQRDWELQDRPYNTQMMAAQLAYQNALQNYNAGRNQNYGLENMGRQTQYGMMGSGYNAALNEAQSKYGAQLGNQGQRYGAMVQYGFDPGSLGMPSPEALPKAPDVPIYQTQVQNQGMPDPRIYFPQYGTATR